MNTKLVGLVVGVVCCLQLAGCGGKSRPSAPSVVPTTPPSPTYLTSAQVMNATVQKWDKYEQKEVIESPLLTSNEPREGIHEDHYYIDAQLKGGRRTYALLLAHYSESWFFLQSAQDSAGKTLSASRLDEEVLSGQIRETFSISVSREYLDRAAETVGLDIQVEGKRNNCYLKVPAYFVRGFLEKVDQIGIK